MTRSVLLTAFEPFDGASDNPSAAVVTAVGAGWERPERLVTAVLPVSFVRAGTALEALLEQHAPDVAVGVGLAAGRARPGLERLAVNLCDARIPDEDGDRPADRPVLPGGPLARRTTLPVKATLRRLRGSGVDVELSMTAGTFVCNAVFYRSAAWAAEASGRRSGFVHVPATDVGVSARVVRAAVDDALDVEKDETVALGDTD